MMQRWQIITIFVAAAVGFVFVVLSGALVQTYSGSPVNPCSNSAGSLSSNTLTDTAYMSPWDRFNNSDLVVIGKILDSTAKCEGSHIMTFMQIQVEESLKNPQDLETLAAKSYGGKIGNYGIWREDSPIFNEGQRAFLYLYKDPGDDAYTISPFSGVLMDQSGLPDEKVSAKEIFETFRLQFVTGNTAVDVVQGGNKEVILRLESFFGYDSPTNVTLSSFTYYNSNSSDSSNTMNIASLSQFGLEVQPSFTVMLPTVNGTAEKTFQISASDNAVLGTYDIFVSSTSEDRYSSIAGGIDNAYVRITVIENN